MSGRRLRVVQVGKFYPPHPGGMESHLEALCRGIAGDVDVEVVVSASGRRTTHEVRDGVPVTRVGTVATLASASFCPGTAAALRRARADVVHFHHPNPPAALSYLTARHRGPLVVTYHSDVVRQRVLGAAAAPLTDALLRRADAVIASSPDYARGSPVLTRHADRVRVIPFGIDPAPPSGRVAAEGAALRARHGPRMVLGAGRLVYYKGFRYLLQAMERVEGSLVLVGDGPLRGELEALARSARLAGRVHFAGTVPDVRPYYAAADVFVLPSVARSEAFGIVQLEAMAAGVPVVNTALDTGVPFVSPHGETGITVPPADADALADAIRRLLDDDRLRARCGRAARERVASRFTLSRMISDTLAVYREAAAARAP